MVLPIPLPHYPKLALYIALLCLFLTTLTFSAALNPPLEDPSSIQIPTADSSSPSINPTITQTNDSVGVGSCAFFCDGILPFDAFSPVQTTTANNANISYGKQVYFNILSTLLPSSFQLVLQSHPYNGIPNAKFPLTWTSHSSNLISIDIPPFQAQGSPPPGVYFIEITLKIFPRAFLTKSVAYHLSCDDSTRFGDNCEYSILVDTLNNQQVSPSQSIGYKVVLNNQNYVVQNYVQKFSPTSVQILPKYFKLAIQLGFEVSRNDMVFITIDDSKELQIDKWYYSPALKSLYSPPSTPSKSAVRSDDDNDEDESSYGSDGNNDQNDQFSLLSTSPTTATIARPSYSLFYNWAEDQLGNTSPESIDPRLYRTILPVSFFLEAETQVTSTSCNMDDYNQPTISTTTAQQTTVPGGCYKPGVNTFDCDLNQFGANFNQDVFDPTTQVPPCSCSDGYYGPRCENYLQLSNCIIQNRFDTNASLLFNIQGTNFTHFQHTPTSFSYTQYKFQSQPTWQSYQPNQSGSSLSYLFTLQLPDAYKTDTYVEFRYFPYGSTKSSIISHVKVPLNIPSLTTCSSNLIKTDYNNGSPQAYLHTIPLYIPFEPQVDAFLPATLSRNTLSIFQFVSSPVYFYVETLPTDISSTFYIKIAPESSTPFASPCDWSNNSLPFFITVCTLSPIDSLIVNPGTTISITLSIQDPLDEMGVLTWPLGTMVKYRSCLELRTPDYFGPNCGVPVSLFAKFPNNPNEIVRIDNWDESAPPNTPNRFFDFYLGQELFFNFSVGYRSFSFLEWATYNSLISSLTFENLTTPAAQFAISMSTTKGSVTLDKASFPTVPTTPPDSYSVSFSYRTQAITTRLISNKMSQNFQLLDNCGYIKQASEQLFGTSNMFCALSSITTCSVTQFSLFLSNPDAYFSNINQSSTPNDPSLYICVCPAGYSGPGCNRVINTPSALTVQQTHIPLHFPTWIPTTIKISIKYDQSLPPFQYTPTVGAITEFFSLDISDIDSILTQNSIPASMTTPDLQLSLLLSTNIAIQPPWETHYSPNQYLVEQQTLKFGPLLKTWPQYCPGAGSKCVIDYTTYDWDTQLYTSFYNPCPSILNCDDLLPLQPVSATYNIPPNTITAQWSTQRHPSISSATPSSPQTPLPIMYTFTMYLNPVPTDVTPPTTPLDLQTFLRFLQEVPEQPAIPLQLRYSIPPPAFNDPNGNTSQSPPVFDGIITAPEFLQEITLVLPKLLNYSGRVIIHMKPSIPISQNEALPADLRSWLATSGKEELTQAIFTVDLPTWCPTNTNLSTHYRPFCDCSSMSPASIFTTPRCVLSSNFLSVITKCRLECPYPMVKSDDCLRCVCSSDECRSAVSSTMLYIRPNESGYQGGSGNFELLGGFSEQNDQINNAEQMLNNIQPNILSNLFPTLQSADAPTIDTSDPPTTFSEYFTHPRTPSDTVTIQSYLLTSYLQESINSMPLPAYIYASLNYYGADLPKAYTFVSVQPISSQVTMTIPLNPTQPVPFVDNMDQNDTLEELSTTPPTIPFVLHFIFIKQLISPYTYTSQFNPNTVPGPLLPYTVVPLTDTQMVTENDRFKKLVSVSILDQSLEFSPLSPYSLISNIIHPDYAFYRTYTTALSNPEVPLLPFVSAQKVELDLVAKCKNFVTNLWGNCPDILSANSSPFWSSCSKKEGQIVYTKSLEVRCFDLNQIAWGDNNAQGFEVQDGGFDGFGNDSDNDINIENVRNNSQNSQYPQNSQNFHFSPTQNSQIHLLNYCKHDLYPRYPFITSLPCIPNIVVPPTPRPPPPPTRLEMQDNFLTECRGGDIVPLFWQFSSPSPAETAHYSVDAYLTGVKQTSPIPPAQHPTNYSLFLGSFPAARNWTYILVPNSIETTSDAYFRLVVNEDVTTTATLPSAVTIVQSSLCDGGVTCDVENSACDVENGQCVCQPGFDKISLQNSTSFSCKRSCDGLCGDNGTCSDDIDNDGIVVGSKCICSDGFTGLFCRNTPLCLTEDASCNGNGYTSFSLFNRRCGTTCTCYEPWKSPQFSSNLDQGNYDQCTICPLYNDFCEKAGTDLQRTSLKCTKCECKTGFGGNKCQYREVYSQVSFFASTLESMISTTTIPTLPISNPSYISQNLEMLSLQGRSVIQRDISLSIGVPISHITLLDLMPSKQALPGTTLLPKQNTKNARTGSNDNIMITTANGETDQLYFTALFGILSSTEISALPPSTSSSVQLPAHPISSLQVEEIEIDEYDTVPLLSLYSYWDNLLVDFSYRQLGYTETQTELGQLYGLPSLYDPNCPPGNSQVYTLLDGTTASVKCPSGLNPFYTATPERPDDYNTTNIGLIIGLIVLGLFILFIFWCILSVFCFHQISPFALPFAFIIRKKIYPNEKTPKQAQMELAVQRALENQANPPNFDSTDQNGDDFDQNGAVAVNDSRFEPLSNISSAPNNYKFGATGQVSIRHSQICDGDEEKSNLNNNLYDANYPHNLDKFNHKIQIEKKPLKTALKKTNYQIPIAPAGDFNSKASDGSNNSNDSNEINDKVTLDIKPIAAHHSTLTDHQPSTSSRPRKGSKVGSRSKSSRSKSSRHSSKMKRADKAQYQQSVVHDTVTDFPLKPGWVRQSHLETGQVFYFHQELKLTQSVPPYMEDSDGESMQSF